jgi:hypothetical protein
MALPLRHREGAATMHRSGHVRQGRGHRVHKETKIMQFLFELLFGVERHYRPGNQQAFY